MFRDAFVKLDALEIETLLQQLNRLVEGSEYDAQKITILAMALPFYPGFSLLELADHSTMPTRKHFIVANIAGGADQAFVLDWTNNPIYRLNEKAPIRLDEKNVFDYVRFFFSFVRGRHGRFLITESVDDIAWKDEPPATARKAIGNLIEPIRLHAIDRDGTFNLVVRMIFKDSLFKSNVRIAPDGLVTLQDEELVVEDIPVLDDVLGQ